MGKHVHCPQCGGDQIKRIRPQVNAQPQQSVAAGQHRWDSQPTSGGTWGSGTYWFPSGNDLDGFGGVVLGVVVLVVLPIVLGVLVVRLVRWLGRRSRAVEASRYSCLRCGFEWTPGQTFPTVSAPPTLT